MTVDTGAATYTKVELGGGTIVEEALVITGAGHSIVTVKGDEPQQHINKAVVDFGDDSGLGNDLLQLRVFCTVTLAQAPGSSAHDIFVKDVDVNGGLDIKPTTLFVADKSIIDHLDVIEGRAFILETAHGTEVDLFDVYFKERGYIEGRSTIGTFNIDGEVEFYESSAPSTVTTFDILTATLAQSNGIVRLCFGSKVTALTSSTIADLNICVDAEFTLQQRPQPPAPGNSRVLTVRSLFIEKLPDMPMAVLDLKDNAMIIDYSESSPLEEIRQYITHAYDVTGSTYWITGVIPHDGITTSLGDSSIHALGYAENDRNSSSTGGVAYTSFAGQDVDDTSVLPVASSRSKVRMYSLLTPSPRCDSPVAGANGSCTSTMVLLEVLVLTVNVLSSSSPSMRYWPIDPPSNPDPGPQVSVPFLHENVHLTVDTGAAIYARVFLGGGTIGQEALVITGAGYSHVNLKGTSHSSGSTRRWLN